MTAIRLATTEDIPAVVALIDSAYRHYIPQIGRRPRPMDDDQLARISRGELFVLEDGGTLLGVLTMSVQPDAIHIFNLAIDPAAQGRGLLRQMVDYAKAAAQHAGKSKLTLYTNLVMTKNRAIYAHLGFIETREEVTPAGYHIVFMERPLA